MPEVGKSTKTNKKTKWTKPLEEKFADDDPEQIEVESLRKRVTAEAPETGYQRKSNGTLRFDSLPISKRTIQGLSEGGFHVSTDIQAAAIPHALAGRDVLGAAKTGSGKSLAFIIPIIERLFCERWAPEDGLAAIVITPTRELAMQIFEVLRVAGKKHEFSAGVVTGGKNSKEIEGEQERIISMNILIATPGRLLHVRTASPPAHHPNLISDDKIIIFTLKFLHSAL
jgi:ATP-dependent RNA helicase DDX10/DBP4